MQPNANIRSNSDKDTALSLKRELLVTLMLSYFDKRCCAKTLKL